MAHCDAAIGAGQTIPLFHIVNGLALPEYAEGSMRK